MNPREKGFTLLTSTLGNPQRKPLTIAQFRNLAQRAKAMEKPLNNRDMIPEDIVALGYSREDAVHILSLLSQEEQLAWYIQKGKTKNCIPITRVSQEYPQQLRVRLGLDAPGILWAKGDLAILTQPGIALVGSRDLNSDNLAFAAEVGRQAALQSFVLISGNARGADKTAQNSCLAHGGKVISVVADSLEKQSLQENVLYLSEEGFDLSFSGPRALQRNRIIHSLGHFVLVAQCTYGKGGTWSGTARNLRHRYCPVYCYQDGSNAMQELHQMGAEFVDMLDLADIPSLANASDSLI